MGKIFTVNLPDIGEGVVEGEVLEWLKQPNDPLEQDEPVVIVMTDKATVELPAPYPGKLVKQYFKVGEIAYKDKPLYDIEVEGKGSENKPENKSQPEPAVKNEPKTSFRENIKPQEIQPTQKSTDGKVLASPATRKLAKEMGIKLTTVAASGHNQEVTKEDLRQHVTQSHKTKCEIISLPGDEEVPLIGIRQLMAKKMAESKKEIPHFSYFEQVDATRLVKLKDRFKEEAVKEGVSVTFMPFIIKALSMAIKQYPEANSTLNTEKNCLILHKEQHIGIAMSTSYGLIVPVLRNVEAQSLPDLIRAFHELKVKASTNKLHSHDMKGSTISISNFGVLDGKGLWATPIINWPEVAILAVARIQKEPVVKNSEIVIRDMLNLSWSFDHRVMDGEFAAKFSHCFANYLNNPASLL